MLNKKIKVAVVFGSRSVEHEVSIVTAMQIFENIDRQKYEVIPVYIDKSGRWLVSDKLQKIENFKDLKLKNISAKECLLVGSPNNKLISKSSFGFFKQIPVDIFMPLIHGTYGEDGTLQGLLEMADMPYTGSGVVGSAVGMDKIIQKAVFKDAGINTVKYVWFLKSQWRNGQKDKKEILDNIEKNLMYPLFVKPANLGSSVGINRASNLKELENAIEIASHFDRRILIEEGKENIIEINCSVLGNSGDLQASVCEQPINQSEKMLTYEDKYLKGGKTKGMAGLSRLVPAPISDELAKKIQETAKIAFGAVDASGIARIDFLVDVEKNNIWINEINTLPGSVSFYLWEKSGIDFKTLIDKLIDLGFEKYKEKKEITFSYETDLILKTSGGSKR
ncbi:D-alanine--D-alanine ligase [Candidatus Wolfebacteria bacterium]|nr:D-alanine--D-alanine ligase [Candidatus Wolfebacteria bacterium]